jgi:exodeoxyribonuclease VII small subunit
MTSMTADADGPTAAEPHAGSTFEAALDRLNEIVERIEGDSLELDEALALFEEGVRLLRYADTVLESADTRILQLLEDAGGGVRLEPMPEEP